MTGYQQMGLMFATSVDKIIDAPEYGRHSLSLGAALRCIGNTAYLIIPLNTASENITFLTDRFKICLRKALKIILPGVASALPSQLSLSKAKLQSCQNMMGQRVLHPDTTIPHIQI